jgi:hypothetical protein
MKELYITKKRGLMKPLHFIILLVAAILLFSTHPDKEKKYIQSETVLGRF